MKPLEYRQLLVGTLNSLNMAAIDEMCGLFLDAHSRGAQIFTFGNGGSGATASHAAGDFLKGASFGLEKRFRMICLNDNVPSMMAIANDIGWDDIFVEPMRNFICAGDLAIGISGSGNSKNVLRAIDYAKAAGATTVGMTGFKGGSLKGAVDLWIHSDAMDMEVAEDVHMAVFNMVKKVCMSRLLPSAASMGSVYDDRVR